MDRLKQSTGVQLLSIRISRGTCLAVAQSWMPVFPYFRNGEVIKELMARVCGISWVVVPRARRLESRGLEPCTYFIASLVIELTFDIPSRLRCQTTASGSSPSFVSGAAVSTSGRTEWQVVAHEIGHNLGAIVSTSSFLPVTNLVIPVSSSSSTMWVSSSLVLCFQYDIFSATASVPQTLLAVLWVQMSVRLTDASLWILFLNSVKQISRHVVSEIYVSNHFHCPHSAFKYFY